MFNQIDEIEKIVSKLRDFKGEPAVLKGTRVAGLSVYQNERLGKIKANCIKAETLIGLSYFIIGENLLEAREILPKGDDFKEWVKNNCNFKIRTAYNTMTAVLILRENPALIGLDKNLLYYMGTRTFPKKLITLLSDSTVGDFNITKVDLMALEAGYLAGEINEDSKSVLDHLKKQNNVDINKRWLVETNSVIRKIKSESSKLKAMQVAQEQIVGKNATIEAWCKGLGDILDDAVKKAEDLSKKIATQVPLKKPVKPTDHPVANSPDSSLKGFGLLENQKKKESNEQQPTVDVISSVQQVKAEKKKKKNKPYQKFALPENDDDDDEPSEATVTDQSDDDIIEASFEELTTDAIAEPVTSEEDEKIN